MILCACIRKYSSFLFVNVTMIVVVEHEIEDKKLFSRENFCLGWMMLAYLAVCCSENHFATHHEFTSAELKSAKAISWQISIFFPHETSQIDVEKKRNEMQCNFFSSFLICIWLLIWNWTLVAIEKTYEMHTTYLLMGAFHKLR